MFNLFRSSDERHDEAQRNEVAYADLRAALRRVLDERNKAGGVPEERVQ